MDLNSIFQKAKEVQDKMQQAKENLGHITQTAEAGAGMVKVTVNGKKLVTHLEMDPQLLKPEDAPIVKELIMAATNKALTDIDSKIAEELKKSTEGLLPNIPGFNFGSF